jgi:hypothetical protein
MALDFSVEVMPDSNSRFERGSTDRRSVLAALGTAAATGLAGCGGDDTEDEGGGDNEANGNTQSPQTGSDGDGTRPGGDGTQPGGGNCPAVPSSYTREDVPATVADETLATIDAPASGPSVERSSGLLAVVFNMGSINVQSQSNSDTTVEDELSPTASEVTDEYDLPAGARAQREAVPSTVRIDVYIPAAPDVVMVSVAASGPDNCLDGSLGTVRDRMVNSIQLA